MVTVPKYQRVFFVPIKSVAAADVTVGYSAFGSAFDRPIRMIRIKNFTDKDVAISFDGTATHLYIKAGEIEPWDFATNTLPEHRFFISELTQVYLKYIEDPTTGSVHLESVGNVL